jgi:hypothetical protein
MLLLIVVEFGYPEVTILTSWFTFTKHFHVKWLSASPSSLLEPVVSITPNTATLTADKTPIITTNTNTDIDTTIPTIFKTTAMPERLDQKVGTQHVTPVPARLGVKLTTTTTVTALNNTIVTAKQQDNEDPAVGREEEERGVEKQDRTSEREAE